MNFIFLLLLLPVLAGAQVDSSNGYWRFIPYQARGGGPLSRYSFGHCEWVPAVMSRHKAEKEWQAIYDFCVAAFDHDLATIFGKTYIVNLDCFADHQTILCPICRKDWYKGSNTLILKHKGKIIDRIKAVKLFPPRGIFQWYALPSHRGDGPVTHEHGKHSCVLYFDGLTIKEQSRQQATMPVMPTKWSVEGKIFALQARLDSLEAKLSRVHIDSVMVAGEWSFTPRRVDQYWIPPHWKQIISFDPEGE